CTEGVISDARVGPLAPESLIRAGPRKAFEGGPARLCLEPHGSVANSRPTRLIHYRVCARLGKGGLKHAQLLAGHANTSTTGDMAEVLGLLAADRSVPDDDENPLPDPTKGDDRSRTGVRGFAGRC